MSRLVFCLLLVLHVPWTVVAFRGGAMPLLGFDSPGGALFGLAWFGVVQPVSTVAVACLAWGLEGLVGRLAPRAGAAPATAPSPVPAAAIRPRRRAADRQLQTARREVAEAQAAHQGASVRGLVDPLTGLLSRDGLLAALPAIRGACAVALVDLDRLIRLTSPLGPTEADGAMRRVADVVRRGRLGDLVAAWSDTQLVLVLPHTAGDGAAARVGRILDEVYAEVRVGGHPVSVSAGIADATGGAGFASALEQAEQALASARPRVCVAV
jgi:GGDEF domain-containing protein